MANQALTRLRKELIRLQKEPVPLIEATPLDSNILEWHYVLQGPPQSPFEGGYYHGKIKFPAEYPFKPPSILMSTPSGRFKPDTRLCLTMSDFHPESWNPLWSVSSILSGLQSFMLESQPTVGSVESSDATKRALAAKSLAHNIANPTFCKLFPHYTQIFAEQQAAEQLKAAAAAASSASAESAAIEKTARSADVAAVQGLALAKGNDAAQTAPAGTRRIEWLDSLLFVILVACIAAAVAHFLT